MKKFILKQVNLYMWIIYSETGHQISEPRRCGSKSDAVDWCKAFISSWDCTTFEIEEYKDEGSFYRK